MKSPNTPIEKRSPGVLGLVLNVVAAHLGPVLQKLFPVPERFMPADAAEEATAISEWNDLKDEVEEVKAERAKLLQERDGFERWIRPTGPRWKAAVVVTTLIVDGAAMLGSTASFVKANLIQMGDSWVQSLLFVSPLILIGPVAEHLVRKIAPRNERRASATALAALAIAAALYVGTIALQFGYHEKTELGGSAILDLEQVAASGATTAGTDGGSGRDNLQVLLLSQIACSLVMAGCLTSILFALTMPFINPDWRIRNEEVERLAQIIKDLKGRTRLVGRRITELEERRKESDAAQGGLDLFGKQ